MEFRAARDFLLAHREDYETAYRDFEWPRPEHFNWALDWFDAIAAGNDRTALWIVDDDGTETRRSFAELSARSDALAGWLREQGVRRGDRTLLMLGNRAELWECMLALTKLGAVMIPSTTLLMPADITDRVERGHVAHVIAESAQTAHFAHVAGSYSRIAVGETVEGWLRYDNFVAHAGAFAPDGPTLASDPLFLYFTSGTTAKPKLVEHTQVSYPVGHLSTMYWLALQPGDVHLNISSPGWAKHAWSNLFAPWNAEATVLILNASRFTARRLLDTLTQCSVTSLCAPPTVWRMVIQEDLSAWQPPLREVLSAGEPLNPEVIEQVRRTRGASPFAMATDRPRPRRRSPITSGQPVKPGSMGRPLPGYVIDLHRSRTAAASTAIPVRSAWTSRNDRFPGLMTGIPRRQRAHSGGDARRLLSHRGCRVPRCRGLHHLRRTVR
jgi:acetyl-CoA synthetase